MTWIVQDVFLNTGAGGPGYTVHEDRDEATAEAERRHAAAPFEAVTCPTCGSLRGLDGPLQGGCNECR